MKCSWCESDFVFGVRRRFCTTKCKNNYHWKLKNERTRNRRIAAVARLAPRTCVKCKREYKPHRINQRFCEVRCCHLFYWQRRHDRIRQAASLLKMSSELNESAKCLGVP